VSEQLQPSSSFDILPLRPEPGYALVTAFRDVLLLLLSRMDASVVADPRVHDQIALCRIAVRNADDPSEVAAAGEQLLTLFSELVARGRIVDLHAELKTAIAAIRETIVSVAGEEDLHREELENTAQRFAVLQDINDVKELKICLLHEVKMLKALTARREARFKKIVSAFEARIASLEHQLIGRAKEANHDELTGLANRRYVAARFAQLQEQRRTFVLAMVDIDNFKRVNDEQGHARGDAVLQAVAQLLLSSVRTTDVVARIGGDEFVVLLLDLTLHQAECRLRALAHRVRSELGEAAGGLDISFSCGLAEYSAGDTLQSLMHRADQGLYQAKRLGKNRVVSRPAPYIRDFR
jgi:diguanylate cyclase (GGDEF)-like protein